MKALGLIEVNGYLAGIEAADAALKAASVKLIALEKVNAGITNVQITGDIGAVKAAVDAGKLAAESLGMLRAYHVIPRLHEETLKLFPSINKEVEKNSDIPVNNSDFKVDEKFKKEYIGTKSVNKDSINQDNKDEKNSISEKDKDNKEEKIRKNKEVEVVRQIEAIKEMKKAKEEEIAEIKEEKTQNVKETKTSNNNDYKKTNKDEFVLKENSKLKKKENLVDYGSMRVDELRKLVTNLNLPHLTNKQIKFEKKDELIKILLEHGREDGK